MNENTENEPEAQELSEANQNELLLYGEIFYQLIQRPWFKELVETRFDFQKIINEEERTIELRVIEVPLEVVAKRLSDRQKAAKEAGPQLVDPTDAKVRALRESLG